MSGTVLGNCGDVGEKQRVLFSQSPTFKVRQRDNKYVKGQVVIRAVKKNRAEPNREGGQEVRKEGLPFLLGGSGIPLQ